MKTKVLNEAPERTLMAVLDSGEEVSACLRQVATGQNITAARITGIGALSEVTLGFFDFEKKDYRQIELKEQVEVLSLVGNIALHGPDQKVHAHIVVGKSDGTAHGGHLLKGRVHPTLEIIIVESPEYLQRKIDPQTNLPLLDPTL